MPDDNAPTTVWVWRKVHPDQPLKPLTRNAKGDRFTIWTAREYARKWSRKTGRQAIVEANRNGFLVANIPYLAGRMVAPTAPVA